MVLHAMRPEPPPFGREGLGCIFFSIHNSVEVNAIEHILENRLGAVEKPTSA